MNNPAQETKQSLRPIQGCVCRKARDFELQRQTKNYKDKIRTKSIIYSSNQIQASAGNSPSQDAK